MDVLSELSEVLALRIPSILEPFWLDPFRPPWRARSLLRSRRVRPSEVMGPAARFDETRLRESFVALGAHWKPPFRQATSAEIGAPATLSCRSGSDDDASLLSIVIRHN